MTSCFSSVNFLFFPSTPLSPVFVNFLFIWYSIVIWSNFGNLFGLMFCYLPNSCCAGNFLDDSSPSIHGAYVVEFRHPSTHTLMFHTFCICLRFIYFCFIGGPILYQTPLVLLWSVYCGIILIYGGQCS